MKPGPILWGLVNLRIVRGAGLLASGKASRPDTRNEPPADLSCSRNLAPTKAGPGLRFDRPADVVPPRYRITIDRVRDWVPGLM
jgi:hypothetical protein